MADVPIGLSLTPPQETKKTKQKNYILTSDLNNFKVTAKMIFTSALPTVDVYL
jgi:hypothetical protein